MMQVPGARIFQLGVPISQAKTKCSVQKTKTHNIDNDVNCSGMRKIMGMTKYSMKLQYNFNILIHCLED